MTLRYPSPEFDFAVSAACHGTISDRESVALCELLRSQSDALDEYILRVELHSRLASNQNLYLSCGPVLNAFNFDLLNASPEDPSLPTERLPRTLIWLASIAACFVLIASGFWWRGGFWRSEVRVGTTSKAVAMLNRVVAAKWDENEASPKVGAPLEPGPLRLESGFAQIVFYSGARLVLEGPTSLQVVSATEASCKSGRVTAEVPVQARGFHIDTPQLTVTELGVSYGLNVSEERTELHVFSGRAKFQAGESKPTSVLQKGSAVRVDRSRPPSFLTSDSSSFAAHFNLHEKSIQASSLRFNQWCSSGIKLNSDPSLLVRFDFQSGSNSDFELINTSANPVSNASIVGCQWIAGRWPNKLALEFQSVNDRVRLNVPGQMDGLTLAAWVRVHGLDRKFSSLFMCEGFAPGTVHWLIRNDGVIGLTVMGQRSGEFQVAASPPVVNIDQFGMWLHLAVVLDGNSKRVSHFANGHLVSDHKLKIDPPYFVGDAELGNWSSIGLPHEDSTLIRNFSGDMDEFSLFSRALANEEILEIYSNGKPQLETPRMK